MSFKDQKAYEGIAERLGKVIKNGKLSHAYIIEGDNLSGKEDFALDFAKAILCPESPGVGCDKCKTCKMINSGTYRDLYRVEADDRSLKQGQIEELQDRLSKTPMEERGRNIAIIGDSDTMTSRAQNRLLKTLEEPPLGTVIMLLSENSENLLRTIRSRCQTIRLYSGIESPITPEMESLRDLARNVMGMIDSGRYFHEIKREVETVADKKTALLFLDLLETEYRSLMLKKGKAGRTADKEISRIGVIEKAREDIRYNVREKYVLCDLILKLEDC